MKTIEISTASKPLSEYAREFGDEVIVLTLHEEPVAAIVSLRGVDRESLSLSTSPQFIAIMEQAREEFAAGKTFSLEELKREVLRHTRPELPIRIWAGSLADGCQVKWDRRSRLRG